MKTRQLTQPKQKGIATLLLVIMVGLAVSTLSMAIMSSIAGAQKSQIAVHAVTQSQVKAWQGMQTIWTYLDQTLVKNTISSCISTPLNCPDISLVSSDSTVTVSIPKSTAYNSSTKTVTISSTGTSGGTKSILEGVYALSTGNNVYNTGGSWQFGGKTTFNGNPTFENIPSIQIIVDETLTLNGSNKPPTSTITSIPPVDFDALKEKSNFVFYIDKNSSCTGGIDTSAAANTSTNTCLKVSNIKTSGGVSLDGVYTLSGCSTTSGCTASALSTYWSSICVGTPCITRANPSGSSIGGRWTFTSNFDAPGVVWVQGDILFNAGSFIDSFIVTGDFDTGGVDVSITAPNVAPSAAVVCNTPVWPTNLCTAYGGALTYDAIANTTIISGGSKLADIKKLTSVGNMYVSGDLTGLGNTSITGTIIVRGGTTSTDTTFNGSKFTGNTSGVTGTIVTGTTVTFKALWLRYL